MNRFFTLLLAASCLTAVGQVPDYVPTDGLVGWWAFDGNAQDASVNEIDLIEVGDVHFESDRFGNIESVIAFNGIDGESRVEFPNFGLIDGWSQGTLSFWVNVIQHDVTGHYFGFDNMFSVRQRHGVNTQFMIALLGGTTRVRVHLDGGLPNSGDLVSQQSLNIGQWHLVTVTFNGVEEMQHIYIDGELDSSMPSGASITTLASPDMLAFGFYDGVGSGSSSSLMDEVGLWDRELNAFEVLSLFLTTAPIEGCTEESACNFDSGATVDDGSCHYHCQYCKEGTVWDEAVQGCVVANPSDSNFDGCVQLNDLLDLLSAYGDCGAEGLYTEGNPVMFNGQEYQTIQIGGQVWFTENLRTRFFSNGDEMVNGSGNWVANLNAAYVEFGTAGGACSSEGSYDACSDDQVEEAFGLLYNFPAVIDERGICPLGWRIPSDSDWFELELLLGMDSAELDIVGWRGTNQGLMMKASGDHMLGWDGSNEAGLELIPSGYTSGANANSNSAGVLTRIWTTTEGVNGPWIRELYTGQDGVNRYQNNDQADAFSIRCIKNAE